MKFTPPIIRGPADTAGLVGREQAHLLSSRYEWKYVVPPDAVQALRQFISPFVRHDRFAAGRRGGSYPICSLYLDSPDLRLCRQTMCGEKNRFKLRIRSYCDDPASPVWFEIKRKINGVVRKKRQPVARSDIGRLLNRGPAGGGMHPALQEFLMLARQGGAGPVVRIAYRREAYESSGGDPVRMTFDTDLRYLVTGSCRTERKEPGWIPVPLEGTIMEVKFTERYPGWISDMVRLFDLQRCSVAKYVMSMERAVDGGRYLSWTGTATERMRES